MRLGTCCFQGGRDARLHGLQVSKPAVRWGVTGRPALPALGTEAKSLAQGHQPSHWRPKPGLQFPKPPDHLPLLTLFRESSHKAQAPPFSCQPSSRNPSRTTLPKGSENILPNCPLSLSPEMEWTAHIAQQAGTEGPGCLVSDSGSIHSATSPFLLSRDSWPRASEGSSSGA